MGVLLNFPIFQFPKPGSYAVEVRLDEHIYTTTFTLSTV